MDARPDRFEAATEDIGQFEMAQLGDLHWASSTLRDLELPAGVLRPWRDQIEALTATVNAGLAGIVRAGAARDDAALDTALSHQIGLWRDIEDFLLRLSAAVPAVLESEWTLPPPLRDLKNTIDRSEP